MLPAVPKGIVPEAGLKWLCCTDSVLVISAELVYDGLTMIGRDFKTAVAVADSFRDTVLSGSGSVRLEELVLDVADVSVLDSI